MTEREEGKLEQQIVNLTNLVEELKRLQRETRDENRNSFVTKELLTSTILQMGETIDKGLSGLRVSIETTVNSHIEKIDKRQDLIEKDMAAVKVTYRVVIAIFGLIASALGIVIAIKTIL